MYAVFFHAHQKIDRVARRLVDRLPETGTTFPDTRAILHFEGRRGPDATRLKKSLDIEQPWHFIDPFDKNDTDLEKIITKHYGRLVKFLQRQDMESAAFEAAWLAHALVDGLTPPHHYPYEQKLAELHGNDREARRKISEKFFVHGDSRRDTFRRSLSVIGPGGLLTTHTLFEGGAFMIMEPLRLNRALPSEDDLKRIDELGLVKYFRSEALAVAELRLFEKFMRTGWTPRLARAVGRNMAPRMVRIVTIFWYKAMQDAAKKASKK